MDLKNLIPERHSKEHALRVAKYIGNDKKLIRELMKCFFASDLKLASRASWIAGFVAVRYPGLLKPYISKIINSFDIEDLNNSLKRNSLRLLTELAIPQKFHGKLMNKCFEYLESVDAAPAVKVYAMIILEDLSNHYTEIKPELKLIIESRFQIESLAFKSRGRKILKS